MHINGTTCSEAEWAMRVDLAAAYNIMDYLQLGEGSELPPCCIKASCRVFVHVLQPLLLQESATTCLLSCPDTLISSC